MIDLSDKAVERRTRSWASWAGDLADLDARMLWSALAEPGDGTACALVSTLGARTALEMLSTESPMIEGIAPSELRAGRERWMPRLRDAEHAAGAAERAGIHPLAPDHPSWPAGLEDLGIHAPLCLWVRGDARAVAASAEGVALVGARAATSYGEHVAAELAAGLGVLGVPTVSGAAYGIDGRAHRAALSVGALTTAWLAGGADRVYPAGHRGLLTGIVEQGGAIVSEVPCGAAPTKWRFLARNRLIAAASRATVVVEAGWRSGSLNTAGHAATLGRPLGAVPGPVTSAASAGCHRLLREYDAQCVTGTDDVQELLGMTSAPGASTETRASAAEVRVVDALSARSPRSIDDIARRSGLRIEDVERELGLLALTGRAVVSSGRWCSVPG